MIEGKQVADGGGGGGVIVGRDEDIWDGMQCSDHPYRTNQGGICALCLQEKLGKLVSSNFPLPMQSLSPSSSSPSFRSEIVVNKCNAAAAASSSSALSFSIRPTSAKTPTANGTVRRYNEYHSGRNLVPFLMAKKKNTKKMKFNVAAAAAASSSSDRAADIVFKRSKSTAAPRKSQFLNDPDDSEAFSPRKRSGGIWSFLYLSTSKPHVSDKIEKDFGENSKIPSLTSNTTTAVVCGSGDSPNSQIEASASASASASSFERKVSRSKSVGCGSRSFSNDLFERISTGFGDCTLRRAESQREAKPPNKVTASAVHHSGDRHCMKERVRCGGLFGGLMTITSSSSSSSSSSYWVASTAEDINVKSTVTGEAIVNGRSKSWGWAFASPIRAFSKQSLKYGKRV